MLVQNMYSLKYTSDATEQCDSSKRKYTFSIELEYEAKISNAHPIPILDQQVFSPLPNI